MAVQGISNVATGAITSTAKKVANDLAKMGKKAIKAPIGDSVKLGGNIKRLTAKPTNLQQFLKSGLELIKTGIGKLGGIIRKALPHVKNFVQKHPIGALAATAFATIFGAKMLSSDKKVVVIKG